MALLFEPSPVDARRDRITGALDAGALGGITGPETGRLFETLRILADAAGVTEPINLNAPYREGHLNVYTSTPAAIDLTHCSRGNAVYDPALDAIFVDLSVVKPFPREALVRLLSDEQQTQPTEHLVTTYLHFVLLHELGHRHLHRGSEAAIFDRGGLSRAMENEADDFALGAMLRAYRKHTLLSQFAGSGIYGETYDSGMSWLNAEEMDEVDIDWPRNRAAFDLVMTLQAMTKGMLLEGYAFSPFHSDEAHSTFVNRSTRLLMALKRVPNLDPAIMNRLRFVERYFARFEAGSRAPAVALNLPGGVRHAAFHEGDLRLVTTVGHVYTASASDIERTLDRPAGSPVGSLRPVADRRVERELPWIRLRGTPSESNFIDRALADDLPPGLGLQKDEYFREVYEQAHPSTLALVQVAAVRPGSSSGQSLDSQFFLAFAPGRQAGRISGRQLRQAASSLGGWPADAIQPTGLTWLNDRFYFRVENAPQAAGRSVLALLSCSANLRCDRIHRLDLGQADGAGFDTTSVALAQEAGAIVGYALAHSETAGARSWQLWRLTAARPPELRLTRPFLPDEPPRLAAPGGGLVDDYFHRETVGSVRGVARLSDRHILVDLKNDSCVAFDTKSGQAHILFHPCGGSLQFAFDGRGRVAIFARNNPQVIVADASEL